MGRRIRKSRAALKKWKDMIQSVKLLNLGFTNIGIYPAAHPEVRDVVRRLHEVLASIFEEHEDMGYGYLDEILYVEGAPSLEETQANETLVECWQKLRLKYLTVDKAASPEDLLRFFVAMNDELAKKTGKPLSELLHAKEVETIHVVEAEPDEDSGKRKGRKTLLDWYKRMIGVLETAHNDLFIGGQADLRPLYRAADDMMATIRTRGCEPFLLLPLMSKGLDPHLAHCVNVAIYSGALGELYGLNSGQSQTLVVGALLHDLGRKIIPPEWTSDPNPLTLFERAVVAQHPSWGFLLLTRNQEIPPQIGLLAARHHERPIAADGQEGYRPDILHKILHAADAYDLALTSDRYYWRKRRPDRFLRLMLARRGEWYDPTIVKLLAQLVGFYPVGTLVRLDDGRRGLVVRPDATHAGRPRVWLIDERAEPLPPARPGLPPEPPPPVMLDLNALDAKHLAFPRSVAGILAAGDLDIPALLDDKKEYLLSHSL